MKKNLAILLGCVTLIILLLTACASETTTVRYENSTDAWNQFVLVEQQQSMDWGRLYIFYDKDTKVMYYMWDGYYAGGLSPIYNADGSVKIYEE